ncbi:hypothetical protein GCM10023317_32750 [Actinopolymorpha pittospori]
MEGFPSPEWSRREHERLTALWRDHAVASPGGWTAPEGTIPPWDWTPPTGARLHLHRMPLWVRIWFYVPFLDRYANRWMWYRGGWDVLPPGVD